MPVLLSNTRLFVIEALDPQAQVVGSCAARAHDRDQAALWAPRLLRWQVGTITLAERGWCRTRVRVSRRWAAAHPHAEGR